jgi:tetratricopeptide (TPR) repeat protein/O-antigen ligase
MKSKSFLLVLFIFIYFTFFGGSLYTLTNFPLKVLNQVIVTLILGLWLWRKITRSKQESLPQTPIDWPIAFWLGVQLLSATFSLYPRFSFESLWQPLTHAMAFYLLIDLFSRYRGDFVRAIYLSSAVVCLIGLMEFASWYFGLPLLPQFAQGWAEIGGLSNPIPPYWYRINFTLNGATSLSAYLALLIPPALAMWLTTQKKDNKQALTVWLVLAALVEVLTFSRGGVLALGISLPIFFATWLILRSPDLSLIGRLPQKVILSGLSLVLVIGLVGLGLFQQRSAQHTSGDHVRLNLWQSAINMAIDYPILGVGPKIYGRALRSYRDPTLARNQLTTAHNLYLNTAAETGILGLVAGSWLIGAFVLAGWRKWQSTVPSVGGKGERLRFVGVAAALAGFGVQCLVDTFNATQIILPVMLGAAYLITPTPPFLPPTGGDRGGVKAGSFVYQNWRPHIMLGLLLAYALVLAKWDLAQYHFQRGGQLAQQNDFIAAITELERAISLDPKMTLYQFEVAYYQSQQAKLDSSYLPQAIETYQRALQFENTNPTYYANLSGLLAQTNDLQGAITAMKTALALAPDDPIFLLNLGYFYEAQGNDSQALDYYAQAVTRLPNLLDTGLWEPAKRQLIIDHTQQRTQDLALSSTLSLVNGDPIQAENLARQAILNLGEAGGTASPKQTEAYLALIRALLARNRPDAALAILADRFPRFGALAGGELYRLRGQARWLQQVDQPGDYQAIIQDLKTALFISPLLNAPAYYILGQIYEAEGDIEKAKQTYAKAVPPQTFSQNYDIVVYGRGTRHPPDVSQLIDVRLGETYAKPWLRLLQLYEAEGQRTEAEHVKESLQMLYPYLDLTTMP